MSSSLNLSIKRISKDLWKETMPALADMEPYSVCVRNIWLASVFKLIRLYSDSFRKSSSMSASNLKVTLPD